MKKDIVILGIHSGHDAGACLIKDGRALFAINEERLSREKMHWGNPYLSIKKVIDLSGYRPSDIDLVSITGLTKPFVVNKYFNEAKPSKKLAEFLLRIPYFRSHNFKEIYLKLYSRNREDNALNKYLKDLGITVKTEYVDHHLAHAASAYYCSQFKDVPEDEIAVITIDGSGDGLCASASEIKNSKLVKRHETVFYNSPSVIYSYVTHNLGFRYLRHEGKITGLAAYGDADKTIDIFRSLIVFDRESLEFKSKLGCWGRPAARKVHNLFQGYKREDVAAGVQKVLEEVICEYVDEFCRRYDKKKVCLAGGVFANVKLNQRIQELSRVEEIYVNQNMGDGGLPLGSALESWASRVENPRPYALTDLYLGPSFDDREIEEALIKNKIKYYKSNNIYSDIARLLADKKILARFYDGMEFGPRALGHRSIMYRTDDNTINDWLNKKLKRTEFMPFAPVVTQESASSYFMGYDQKRDFAAGYMTITYDVTERGKKEAPATTHVDGTARPQIVNKDRGTDSYRILKEYEKITGISILINTSFNMHEEPIVCTPDEAIKSFLTSRLDYLAIGNFIVNYEENKQNNGDN